MIDHLMKAADEAAIVALLGARDPDGRGALWNGTGWRGDISFPCQVLDTSNTTPQIVTNPDGTTITVQAPTPLPYFFLWVALSEVDPVLAALDGIMVIADRDAAQRGKPFMIYAQPPQADLYIYQVSPVIAGSSYPFGAT